MHTGWKVCHPQDHYVTKIMSVRTEVKLNKKDKVKLDQLNDENITHSLFYSTLVIYYLLPFSGRIDFENVFLNPYFASV